jgi:exopolysaccharide biosynthesis protein, sugar transferase
MKKLVSIILPVYNVEKFIEICLDSIHQQTYSNFEVIIVNDGSTDSSIDYCKQICNQDSRFSIINKANGGLSDARNVGIDSANGEYIIFVDSDDFISMDMVSHLVSCLEETDSDIAICDPVHYYSDRIYRDLNIFSSASDIKIFDKIDALCEMLYQKSFLVSAWGKIYKRALFEEIRFPIGKLFEDSAVMYLLFEKCQKIVYSNAKLYAYVHRDNSITTTNFSDRDLDILEITDSIINHYNDNQKIYRAAISYKVSACFRILLNSPSEKKYKKIQKDCLKYILKNWAIVLFDSNVRLKNKLALILITLPGPFVKFIYSKVNRWE